MSKLKEFFMCTRPHSYPAAIAPVLVGSALSLKYIEHFSFLKFFLFLISSLFIQAATNLFNEYYDYKKGLDKVDSEGISGSIVKGKLTAKGVMMGALILYTLAFSLGLILTLLTNYSVLLVGILSMLVGFLYTGGPYPIAYSPFGELFSGFFMGTVIICLAFYLQTNFLNYMVFLVSLPLFLLIATILLANNIRDLENDKVSGRKTLAILVGKQNAINILTLFLSLVYVLNIIFAFTSYGSLFNLIILITLPLAKKIVLGFKNNNDKKTMAPFMVMTAKLTIICGLLITLAYLLDAII